MEKYSLTAIHELLKECEPEELVDILSILYAAFAEMRLQNADTITHNDSAALYYLRQVIEAFKKTNKTKS